MADSGYVWDAEQVAITVAGFVVTVMMAVEIGFGLSDWLSPLAEFVLLGGWLLWFLKLYAQDRVPPILGS
jgi:type IV secretory pathway TrbL component